MSYLSEKDILGISSTVSIFSIASVKEDVAPMNDEFTAIVF